MKINITLFEANVIQVALDHLLEMHEDIREDNSTEIIDSIYDLQREIQYHLDGLKKE